MNIDKIKNKTFPGRNHSVDGMKVLLADDDKLNIYLIKKILSPWDIEITIAENGLSAVEMVKNSLFDLILMDVQMPYMDGFDASKEIRKFNPDIPIVVITSLSYAEVKEHFSTLNIDEFIFKPVNKNNLYQVLLKYALKKKSKAKHEIFSTLFHNHYLVIDY